MSDYDEKWLDAVDNIPPMFNSENTLWTSQLISSADEGKLMRLGVANWIVVIELKTMSEFHRRFRSDSKSKDECELAIAISI